MLVLCKKGLFLCFSVWITSLLLPFHILPRVQEAKYVKTTTLIRRQTRKKIQAGGWDWVHQIKQIVVCRVLFLLNYWTLYMFFILLLISLSHLYFCSSCLSAFECQHELNHSFAQYLGYIYKSICLNLASFSTSHSYRFKSKYISLPPEDREPVAKVIHSIDCGNVSPRQFDIYILGYLPVCHNRSDLDWV